MEKLAHEKAKSQLSHEKFSNLMKFFYCQTFAAFGQNLCTKFLKF